MKINKLAFTLNLIFPGLGQICTGRWICGILYAMPALFFFLASLFEIVYPLYMTITGLFADPSQGEMRYINIWRFLFFLSGVLIVYVVAMVDFIIHARRQE